MIDWKKNIVNEGNRENELELRLKGEKYEEVERDGGGIV